MEMKALPYDTDISNHHKYEVEKSVIAPAFDNIGLGIQYRSPVSGDTLLKHGIIRKLEGD